MPWIRRLRALMQRDKLSRELEEELAFHLSMREQWNVARGMLQEEARHDARRRFGNPVIWREHMSEIDIMVWPQTVLQDLRHGARLLCRKPGFTIVAVLALALGIGINTAAFTAYKAFFKRPLDARNAGQLVNLALIVRSPRSNGSSATLPFFSYLDYTAYRDQAHSFSGFVAASLPQNLVLTGAGGILHQHNSAVGTLVQKLGLLPNAGKKESAVTSVVSQNYFSLLGVSALRGRTFDTQGSAQLGASAIALISENYWQRRFGGDPAILGTTVRLSGIAFTIVGITPHDFVGTYIEVPDFWLPVDAEPLLHPDDNWLHDRENPCCRLYGRLARGVTMDQAQAEMTLLASHLRPLHDAHADLSKPVAALVWPGSPFPLPLKQYSGLHYAVLLILIALWMVLAIACANVASLQLARSAARQNELCLRLSLGASRLRIIRQLLTESALLGLLAGVVAFFFSWALLQVSVVVAADALPSDYSRFIFHVTPDLGVFFYVFALSMVAGVLFGLAPALESARTALSPRVQSGTSLVRGNRLRDFLVTTQVAISLVLMIAGSMLIRSSIRALTMNTGYNTGQTVNLELQFPETSAYTAEHKLAIVHELRARLAALPKAAAITSCWAPDTHNLRLASVALNGEKPSPQNTRAVLYYAYVQPNYWQTLEIPVLAGRVFQLQGGQPEPAVVLSQSAAQTLWPGQNPIGRSLRLATVGQFHGKSELLPDGPAYQVVGIARDTRGVLLDGSDSQQIYLPLPENRMQDYPFLIRTRGNPAQLMGDVGSVIATVDPDLVASSSTLDELLRETPSFLASTFAATIASTAGILGLLLASMGIYGTVSYIVVLRTREVGVRIALGATKHDILALMLGQGMRPVLAGLLAGMGLSLVASYPLRGVLYGLSGIDGISCVGVSLLFFAIALFAAYLPSQRALRIDPVVALRYE